MLLAVRLTSPSRIECTLTDRGRDRLTAAGLFITLLLVYNSNGREIGSYDTQPTKFAARELLLRGTLESQLHRRGDAGVREPVGFHPGGGRKLSVDLLAGPGTDGGGRHVAPVEIGAHRHPSAACARSDGRPHGIRPGVPGGDFRLSARAPVVAARPRAAPGDRARPGDRFLEHGEPDALADGNGSVRTRPGRARVRRAGRAHQRPGRCGDRAWSRAGGSDAPATRAHRRGLARRHVGAGPPATRRRRDRTRRQFRCVRVRRQSAVVRASARRVAAAPGAQRAGAPDTRVVRPRGRGVRGPADLTEPGPAGFQPRRARRRWPAFPGRSQQDGDRRRDGVCWPSWLSTRSTEATRCGGAGTPTARDTCSMCCRPRCRSPPSPWPSHDAREARSW